MADRLPEDLAKVSPQAAWEPWTPTASEPWDRRRVAHLFRRGAFGASPGMVDEALAAGFPATLDKLMRGQVEDDLTEAMTTAGRLLVDGISTRTESTIADLRAWFLYVMIEGGHPLREKLTLFWHNHFATSHAKVRSSKLMFEQNLTLRKHALGRFRPFLLDMSKDTAMLIWLDSNRNEKGAANENFAREVMELFSLGVGNYTEKDVREAARSFTGWHHDVGPVAFEFHPNAHDDGTKTVLGQTGRWIGSDVIRICCDQPACARFLVGKLYAFLVSETAPPKHLLTPLEERFRKSDYDIADLVRTMLGSRLFFSPHAFRKRVKWPVEYVLEAVQSVVPGRAPTAEIVRDLARMGQVLFSPPNVKGWRTGTDWLNSATLLARNNFAETVAMGTWSKPGSQRNGDKETKSEPPPPPDEPMPYHESATAALAGGGACAAIDATWSVAGTPDQKRISFPGRNGPGGKAASGPKPPEAGFDSAARLIAAKPKDLTALVHRMGEMLFGERVPAGTEKRIEAFLREPSPVPKGKKKETDFESQEFKARAREALHALMCLPEYQLN